MHPRLYSFGFNFLQQAREFWFFQIRDCIHDPKLRIGKGDFDEIAKMLAWVDGWIKGQEMCDDASAEEYLKQVLLSLRRFFFLQLKIVRTPQNKMLEDMVEPILTRLFKVASSFSCFGVELVYHF